MSTERTEIEITIDNQGNVSYEVKGLKGKGCIESTKFLDEALGEVKERKHTREFYEENVRQKQRIANRRQ